MPSLRIPESDQERLSILLGFSPEVLNHCYSVLVDAPARLSPRKIVADLVEGDIAVSQADLESAVKMLLTMYWLMADQELTPEALVALLKVAVEQAGENRITPPEAGWERIEGPLISLLSLKETLAVTSKALFLAYQFPRHFHSARILTDARPIYTGEAADPPAAFLIMHTLKLSVHDDGEDGEWFISMNSEDLAELRAAIDRAVEKDRSLAELLEKTDIPVLKWERANNEA